VFFVHSRNYEDILREEKCKIICSYGRKHTREVGEPDIPDGFTEVMIDSGGFQMQRDTGDREVTLAGYAMWLQFLLPNHPEVVSYMNLDVWREGEQSLKNFKYLEAQGLHPIPIWHAGTDLRFMDYYYQNYDYIALGGFAKEAKRDKAKMCQFVDWIYQAYPGRKYHFLGVGLSGTRAFAAHKPYSVDFSTWSVPARFGDVIIYDEVDILKEVPLPLSQRLRLREDKAFEREKIIEAVQRIKQLEQLVEDSTRLSQPLLF